MISRNCRIALLAVCLTLLLCGGALAASLTIHAPEEAKQGSAVKVRVVIDEMQHGRPQAKRRRVELHREGGGGPDRHLVRRRRDDDEVARMGAVGYDSADV